MIRFAPNSSKTTQDQVAEARPDLNPNPSTDPLSNIRDWNEDRFGVSAERLRSCLIYHLDYNPNSWIEGEPTISSMDREKFISAMDRTTPIGWFPGKEKKSFSVAIKPAPEVFRWLLRGPGIARKATPWASVEEKVAEVAKAFSTPFKSADMASSVSESDQQMLVEDGNKDILARQSVNQAEVSALPFRIGGVSIPFEDIPDYWKEVEDPKFGQFRSLPDHEQYRLRVSIPKESWTVVRKCQNLEKKTHDGWTASEVDKVSRGVIACPVCHGRGYYSGFKETLALHSKSEIMIYEIPRKPCHCLAWKHVWREFCKDIPLDYQGINLWTLKPSTLSGLSMDRQQEEIEFIQNNPRSSFLFLGPSGVGKTTFGAALFRRAFERETNRFWTPLLRGVTFGEETRWLWRISFNTLLQQHNDNVKKDWGETGTIKPHVTPDRVAAAKRRGQRPVLILEEIDKLELNAHRVNFLFTIVNAVLENDGQLVVTTNLTLPELCHTLLDNPTLRETGSPLLRRLLSMEVRNLF